ncbi:MAG: hypothetical protein J6W11_00380 [Alphaproteobacteria bacterium]|nr:hypothetical protein [Alphaproteobacteria bacterium]
MENKIDLKTNPKKTEQLDNQKTMQRLKKQMDRAAHLKDICKALMVGTIGMAAIGESIIGFEGIAVAGTMVAVVCAPMLATACLAKTRELKLEKRLDDIKKQTLAQKILHYKQMEKM